MNASLKALASVERGSKLLFSDDDLHRELTITVGEANGKGLSLGLTLTDVGGCVPHPAAVAADVGRELHVRNN
jgi:hypothetical protein